MCIRDRWAAAEGFRSLTSDFAADPRFERLIVGRQERYALLAKGIPARSMGRRVLDAGSDFRSERYPAFLQRERRREAAATFRAQGLSLIHISSQVTTAPAASTPAPVKSPVATFVSRYCDVTLSLRDWHVAVDAWVHASEERFVRRAPALSLS